MVYLCLLLSLSLPLPNGECRLRDFGILTTNIFKGRKDEQTWILLEAYLWGLCSLESDSCGLDNSLTSAVVSCEKHTELVEDMLVT